MADTSSSGHARLMDKVYRRQRHIYDLTRKYYLFGRDRTIRGLGLRPGERLVEIGCGTARNLIAIARRYPAARLYGLDASAEMLKTAETNLRAARLAEAVALRLAYAETLDERTFGPDSGPFDHALFSYSLSMIPDWSAALAAAGSAVRPGGLIHIVDFGDLSGLGGIPSQLLRRWLKVFHVRPREELLRWIERAAPADGDLWVSPGRYAFSFHCHPDSLVRLGLRHVAAGSQSLTKP